MLRAGQTAGATLAAPLLEQRFRDAANERGNGFFLLGEGGRDARKTALHEEARGKVWEHTLASLKARGVAPL